MIDVVGALTGMSIRWGTPGTNFALNVVVPPTRGYLVGVHLIRCVPRGRVPR
jgi:hypothetical protein